MVAEESQFLTFMGIRVHFTVAYPETALKNRLLLLSSPLITTFHWRKLIPELQQLGCLTVMVDLPGFGRSDCTGEVPHDAETRANIMWGILDDVDRQTDAPLSLWHLVGHGVSCSTILRMANLYPDSTKSQVHISPNFSLMQPKNRDELYRWFDTHIRSEEGFRDFIEAQSGYPMDDYVLDRMRRPLLRPGARENLLRMIRHASQEPQEGMGFCPTMVLWGGRDQSMNDTARTAMRRLLPEAETHMLKSAGHFPMETHSRAIRDYLRGWIRYND